MRRRRWVIPAGAISAVVVIAATAVIVGGTLRDPPEAKNGPPNSATQVTVFLRDSATVAQLLALDAKVGSTPGIEGHVYVSKEEALRRYLTQEGASAWVSPMNPLPASYILTVQDMREAYAVARHFVHSLAVNV